MTIPAGEVTDLTFDSTLLQPSDVSFVMWIETGLQGAPTVRGDDTVIPHLAGRVPRSRQADRLIIELEGYILAETPSEFADIRGQLMTLFDGVALPRTLSCTLEDGVTTATIAARPTPPVLLDPIIPSYAARINVRLESVDPYWVLSAS